MTEIILNPDLRLRALNQSLARGIKYLLSEQSPDGAWRSETYGAFKGGDALTPFVVHALQASNDSIAAAAIHKGSAFLAKKVLTDGVIDEGAFGLDYPLYTAALSVLVLRPYVIDQYFATAQAAWLAYLKRRQLTEQWGWQPDDPEYGGWGYSNPISRTKSVEPADRLAAPNLSATVFAIEALRAVVGSEDPAVQKALRFVQRCQNIAGASERHDPAFDDGGFFFVQGDPERNKAGSAGLDHNGNPRFSSYGSTTADGLRALVLCGLRSDLERVRAALRWLNLNIKSTHPGNFAGGREAVQASLRYYYHWSLAKTLACCANQGIIPASKQSQWSRKIGDWLIRCQTAGGNWVNDAVEVREDDQVLATTFAVGALAKCRDVIGKNESVGK